jgi:hypothetical protein
MRKFIKNNWVEIIALVGVLIGIALLFLRHQLMNWVTQIRNSLQSYSGSVSSYQDMLAEYAKRITLPELAGAALALLGILFIALRARYRYLTSQRWLSPYCPRCKSELHRVRRSSFDRFLSRTFLPHARRYLCKNTECRWTGLKYVDHGRRSRHVEADLISEEG